MHHEKRQLGLQLWIHFVKFPWIPRPQLLEQFSTRDLVKGFIEFHIDYINHTVLTDTLSHLLKKINQISLAEPVMIPGVNVLLHKIINLN